MSYDADLINAYRDQLAKIRAAFEALEFEECYAVHGLDELEKAIQSTEADDIENMYKTENGILPNVLHVSMSTQEIEQFKKTFNDFYLARGDSLINLSDAARKDED